MRMSTGRTIDVPAICPRPLALFANGQNAWDHMTDHALGYRERGEEQGWALLLSALQAELAAGNLDEVRQLAHGCSYKNPPDRLEPIYCQFLDCLQRGMERASSLKWFWE